MSELLTEDNFAFHLDALCSQSEIAARMRETVGTPELWTREPGFVSLVQIILEQQVSVSAGQAIWNRLLAEVGTLTPESLLALADAQFKAIGISRQKALYCRALAQEVFAGTLDMDALALMEEAAVRESLCRIKGIGQWTANIYLLSALRRPDIWPAGDRALALAVQTALSLPETPTTDELERIGEMWRPYRAVAARLLWRYYHHTRSTRGLGG